MARVNGIQCDWCGVTADLVGDRAIPVPKTGENPWSTIHVFVSNSQGCKTPGPTVAGRSGDDLCPSCTEAATAALKKAKKQRQTGRKQR